MFKFQKKYFYFILITSTFYLFFTACTKNKEPRLLGKLSIKGADNIFFKVYQEDKFESAVGIYYEIIDKQDRIIHNMEFLVGTSDFDIDNTKDFFTGFQDSIIYLSFINPNDVYAIYDLRLNTKCGSVPCEMSKNIDSVLVNKLKKAKPSLNIK